MGEYYPFGDTEYHDIKDIVQVTDDTLSDEEIKEKIVKALNLSTEYKEEIGHSFVANVEINQILVI